MKNSKGKNKTILCNYCNTPAELIDSKLIYGRSYGLIWVCYPCGARVGCHKGTDKPLGRLANAELREWKQLAHMNFDPLWQGYQEKTGCSKSKARSTLYGWLANRMGIEKKHCHIGMFDVEQCKQVIQISKENYYIREIT